jgi:hypothetical protein
MTAPSRNRPSSDPVQIACQACGEKFMGAFSHALCASCVPPAEGVNDVLRRRCELIEARSKMMCGKCA